MATRTDGTRPMLSNGAVYLRPAEREDLRRFVRWLGDARTSRTLAMVSPFSVAMEERWFDEAVTNQGRTQYHYVICLLADDRAVGTVGLHDLDHVHGSASLGIAIGDPADTGHGYGSGAIRAILGLAFGQLRLERVWLDVYDFNPRARALYERLGFVHEGTLRHALFRDGRHRDVHRMAMLRGEWTA